MKRTKRKPKRHKQASATERRITGIACRCGCKKMLVSPRTFKDATRHQEVRCKNCGSFVKWLERSEKCTPSVPEITHRMTLTCAECGADMVLRQSKYGPFYGCTMYPDCDATHGAHPDGRPLGTPATKEGKAWRIKAHDAFDRLWKEAGLSRKAAYRWMQSEMSMTEDESHIGKFGQEECERLIGLVEEFFETDKTEMDMEYMELTFGSSGGSTEGSARESHTGTQISRYPSAMTQGSVKTVPESVHQSTPAYDPDAIHSWHSVAPDAEPGDDACQEFKDYFTRLKVGR